MGLKIDEWGHTVVWIWNEIGTERGIREEGKYDQMLWTKLLKDLIIIY